VLLAPLALLALFAFAQAAYKVMLTDSGLKIASILKTVSLRWEDIRILKQTNKMGWREYLLIHDGGESCFPCLVNGCAELVEKIRSRLPNRGRSTGGDTQLYRIAPAALVRESGKLALQAGFAALFFYFHDSLARNPQSSREDVLLVLAVAVLISAAVVWKSWQFLRLPYRAQVKREGLSLKGIFSAIDLSWSDIKKMSAAGLLYPDGLFIAAAGKNYLLSNNLDCYDELTEEIQQRRRG
jgi:hypothetical protein